MDYSAPGLPVPHHLSEFAQVHVHWISDAIQPSHPLMPSSPSAISLSQLQGLLQWAGSSHQVAEVFSFSISPSREYSGLISFRTKWFVLVAYAMVIKKWWNLRELMECMFIVQSCQVSFWSGQLCGQMFSTLYKVRLLGWVNLRAPPCQKAPPGPPHGERRPGHSSKSD